jgi:hypothetical protein
MTKRLTSSVPRLVALAAFTLALAASAIALASGGHTHGHARQAPPPRGKRAPIKAVPKAEASQFGALRSGRSAEDDLPAAVRAAISGAGQWSGNSWGANFALARRVDAAAGGTPVYLVPADGYVCAVFAGSPAAFDCRSTSAASAGELLTTIEGSRAEEIVGVVPDGVSAVTVQSQSGSTDSVPVRDNVYKTKTSNARSIEFNGPGGSRELSLHGSP